MKTIKTSSTHKKDNRSKRPAFFDHIFYWLWYYARHGLPDRSFATVSVIQFAYLLFPFAVALQFIDISVVQVLHEAGGWLTICPAILLFFLLIWRNGRIYNENRYHSMQDCYGSLCEKERLYHRRRFLVCMAVTAAIIAIDVWLFIRYNHRCESLYTYPFPHP